MFSTFSDEVHYLERMVHVVYQNCNATPCSTAGALASMTAVRKAELSRKP